MLVHAATTESKICFSASELKCNVDDTFPIDRITRIVGSRFEASGLDRTDSRIAETVTEVAGDTQSLDGTSGRDAKTNRDDSFNMKLLGLRGVLWLGFKDNLGSALRGCGRGTCGLWQRRR